MGAREVGRVDARDPGLSIGTMNKGSGWTYSVDRTFRQ